MPKLITIKVDGLQAAIAKIKTHGIAVEKKLQKHLDTFAEHIVTDAATNLRRGYPAGADDTGHLVNSIKPKIERLKVRVVVAANYAAYVEFGTRKFAAAYVSSLPSDWQAFAAQFKGGDGGTMDQFIKRIVEWVKRKGFAAYETKSGNASKSANSLQAQESAAYIIARLILINGTRPHPFLYPAFEKNRVELLNKLKTEFN